MSGPEFDVLEAVYPKITPSMTSSERADLLVEALLYSGADLRTQPALEEMKRLFIKVMRFRRNEMLSHNSRQAV
jgi:hypothetical protein